jgi:hypothetical protein
MNFDGTAVKTEQQRRARAGMQQMKLAGRADQSLATAREIDGRSVVVGGDGCVGEQAGAFALHRKPTGHDSVMRGHRAHGLLGWRLQDNNRSEGECEDSHVI